MVYVSHQFDEVLRLATHIVLMQSGTVVAQGGIGAMSLDRAAALDHRARCGRRRSRRRGARRGRARAE